jgi:hypothetical protein
MDSAMGMEATLVGAHNYAAQEMVNLLLVGQACSQVFNGDRVLEEGGNGTDRMILKGIPQGGENIKRLEYILSIPFSYPDRLLWPR